MEIKKVFKLETIRDLEFQVTIGEISHSKMVETLNDIAYFYYEIDGKYQKLDDSKITIPEIISYMHYYRRWKDQKYDSDFDRGMSEPNKPGYFRANND